MDKEQKPEIFKPDGAIYTIYKYTKLESTNAFLKQHCSTLPDYSVIWAEEQIHGRGRFTRVWNSEPGQDLTFSLLLPLTSLEQRLRQNITQTAALSVARLLEGYGLKPSIKWPNDVLVDGGKISGILCEVVESDENAYAILGIGLNINSTEESLAGLDYPATSLRCGWLWHPGLHAVLLCVGKLRPVSRARRPRPGHRNLSNSSSDTRPVEGSVTSSSSRSCHSFLDASIAVSISGASHHS